MKGMILLFLGLSLTFCSPGTLSAGEEAGLKITILYDNYVFAKGTTSDWVF